MKNQCTYEAVVIGGSWGGMDALITLLSKLKRNFSLPIMVVLHRQKNVKSSLIEILEKKTKLPIHEADEKVIPLPGHVYIAPSNYHLMVEKNKTLSLDNSEKVNHSRPSIDVLFETASVAYKSTLIGIILTGANSDGSKGLKMIHEYGGLTIAQNPETAESPYMPSAAIKATKIHHILNIPEITEFLNKQPC